MAAALVLFSTCGCTWLPNEFNMSPLYRQRMAEDGTLLELDVLWPFVHYEVTPDGGTDFRIRPFYRRVTEPESPIPELAATEHQFLAPLGRVRHDEERWTGRLFPLWWYNVADNEEGLRESDWYFLFPFFWGGSREDGKEDYFGFFPFYADLPNAIVYDRLQFIMFPLYLGTWKSGRRGHIVVWPFGGWGSGPNGYRWHKLLPFWSYQADEEYERNWVFWPFVHWATEQKNTDNPVHVRSLWPLFGTSASEQGDAGSWFFLWPFFQRHWIAERFFRTVLFWPLFKLEEDTAESSRLFQWWFFPFIARTITDDQWAWSLLWPLMWFRRYADPAGEQTQDWVLPFYWQIHRDKVDGGEDDYVKAWPVYHREKETDAAGNTVRGDWAIPSPFFWRRSNWTGIDEAYGWLYTLAQGRQRAPDDKSMELAGNVYTTRTRGDVTQTSVPFLFNYEGNSEGGTLRLFQFIPIPWSGTK